MLKSITGSNNRPETGAMRFGEDWTGAFIRGDDAHAYSSSLKRILDSAPGQALSLFDRAILDGLIFVLECSRELGWTPATKDIQMLNDYTSCVRFQSLKAELEDEEEEIEINIDDSAF